MGFPTKIVLGLRQSGKTFWREGIPKVSGIGFPIKIVFAITKVKNDQKVLFWGPREPKQDFLVLQ